MSLIAYAVIYIDQMWVNNLDITNALASETTRIIVNDFGHGLFAILCDESYDASTKEQLAVVIRYVDLHGYVIERFLGILHVSDATALSLKKAIDVLFSKHGLSILQIRGQGYDSASNMRDVVLIIENDGLVEQKGQAYAFLNSLQSFEFAFILHLMKKIMGITNALSEALQRKDQDIVNVMGLVKVSKQQLQATREHGWDFLLDEICLFCKKHKIIILKMDEIFITSGRSRRKVQQITNLHHYQVELFCAVTDLQL
ncbi:uncharacterized protein [Coffea arabica]|uniref:DUF4371 domain-containing protein n=1 Tax=Coffea arabica TaxID=13443 RepID=A0A6P6VM29_COFAR